MGQLEPHWSVRVTERGLEDEDEEEEKAAAEEE